MRHHIRLMQIPDLVNRPLRRLTAKSHGHAIQATKGAMTFRAPPAAACGLIIQMRSQLGESGMKLGKELIEIRIGQGIHIIDGLTPRGRGLHGATRCLAREHSGQGDVGCTCQDRFGKRREAVIRFTRKDVIDEWKAGHEARTHLPLDIWPTEHDVYVGMRGLDAPGQGQRGEILLKHSGEAYQGILRPRYGVQALFNKRTGLLLCSGDALLQRLEARGETTWRAVRKGELPETLAVRL